MLQTRREVLKAFKKLHRTRKLVFTGDETALEAGRREINDRFKKNMNETNCDSIKKMIQLALDVDKELRTNIIQAKMKDVGLYELRITPETTRLENFPFNADAVLTPQRKTKPNKGSPCGTAKK